jgi:penicillin-binding protein 1A
MAELEQLDAPTDLQMLEHSTNVHNTKEKPAIRIAERVLDERTAYIINDILKDTIRQAKGTAHDAQRLRRSDIAGKTGTTQDALDAWFSGFNHTLVATSWVGFDDFTSLGTREYGSKAELPAWMEFMGTALKNVPEIERSMPDGLTVMMINKETGKPTLNSDPDARLEIFKIENAPDVSGAKINIGSGEVDPGELF